MCGLLGFASTEGISSRSLKQSFFNTGFQMIAADRGMDSSGLALVSSADKPPLIYKRALDGADFVKTKPVLRFLNDIDKFSVAIGHVRSATAARGDITDWNAHPFQYGHITLVHNGHIRNANDLPNSKEADSFVDSAMVAYCMAKNGEKETLEAIEGGFVFIWWNALTKKLNIARNTERPLFFAYQEKSNSMYWASEITHLGHLLRNVQVDESVGGYLHPEPSQWYQYDLKDLRKYEKAPFVQSQGRRNQQQIHRLPGGERGGRTLYDNYSGWTDEDLARWGEIEEEMSTSTTSKTTSGRTGRTFERSNQEELDEIREDAAEQRRGQAKRSGIPSSKKRIERAKNELKKFGIEYEENRVCIPQTWHTYKNQQGRRGSMMAKMVRGGHLVEILDVPVADFAKYKGNRTVVVKCVNVKHGSKDRAHIIGIISDANEKFQLLRDRQEQSEKDTDGTRQALGSIERNFQGPNGSMVTRARFLELTVQGCAICSGEVLPENHDRVVWAGSPPSPICHGCNNPEMMENLGISDLNKDLVH